MRGRLTELRLRLLAAWPATRAVAADEKQRLVWLKSARTAQITLVAVILAGFTLVPLVVDAAADTVLPPQARRVFFRSRVRRHPGAETLSTIAMGLYWLGGMGTTAALLVLHAPTVVSKREDEHEDATGTAATMIAPGAPTEPVDALGETMSPDSVQGRAEQGTPQPPSRYVITKELGQGGMGVVYEATDSVLGRTVALKQLRRGRLDAMADERFRREARVLAQLRHPGIVQVYDLAEEPTGMWMVMELIEGGALDALIREHGRLDLERALSLGASLAETLAYAHAQEVVHRDFKPANVLLTEAGEPKVTDFGLAKLTAAGPKLTQLGSVLGSPGYMSPEQASGEETDFRTDMYALGVTIYEMVTGRCPFEGDTASVLAAHITKTPPTPAELGVPIPKELEELLARLLAKNPADRPSDLEDVATRLRRSEVLG